MGYIEKNLVPGEKVLYKTRLHWIVLIWPLIGGVVRGASGLHSLPEDMRPVARTGRTLG